MKQRPGAWKRLGTFILLAAVLFVAYLAIQVLVIIPYRHEHGSTYRGAMAKFHASMAAGDTDGAKDWAGRMFHYSSTTQESPSVLGGRLGLAFGYSAFSGPKYQHESYRFLAGAHELAGEYEEALALYEDQGRSSLGAARVYLKTKRHTEAFRAFCQFAMETKNELDPNSTEELTPHHARIARERFLETDLLPYASRHQMSPFRDFPQFHAFMQDGWKETNCDEDYLEAMEFLEAVASSPHS